MAASAAHPDGFPAHLRGNTVMGLTPDHSLVGQHTPINLMVKRRTSGGSQHHGGTGSTTLPQAKVRRDQCRTNLGRLVYPHSTHHTVAMCWVRIRQPAEGGCPSGQTTTSGTAGVETGPTALLTDRPICCTVQTTGCRTVETADRYTVEHRQVVIQQELGRTPGAIPLTGFMTVRCFNKQLIFGEGFGIGTSPNWLSYGRSGDNHGAR